MKYIKGTMSITTKSSDENRNKIAKDICDWADKHEMYVCFGTNKEGEFLCSYVKKGRTLLFCKGYVAELKDLIKVSFNAKVETILEAY